jgi:hypothetical protein
MPSERHLADVLAALEKARFSLTALLVAQATTAPQPEKRRKYHGRR